jgi:Tol biopolymer transport system component
MFASCSESPSDSEANKPGGGIKLIFPPPTSLSWSPDGGWILFLEFSTMQIMKADNTRDIIPFSGTGQYTNPVWSPDGEEIAYVHAARYLASDIWVKSVHEELMPIRLTSHKANDNSPSWSPDGTMIAFQSYRSGNWDIWLIKSDGSSSAIQFTTDPSFDKEPSWSPDGTNIAFLSNRNGSYDIWIRSEDGTEPPRQITNTPGYEENVKWFSDGQQIAYLDKRRSRSSIFVQKVSGSNGEIQITTSGEVSSYDLSSKGDFILYQAGDFIAGQRLDGMGEEVQIDEGKEPICSPDGQKIAYVKFDGERYIITIIDSPAALK